MNAANTWDIGRMAHLPFQTKKDAAVNIVSAKISSDSQVSKVKVGSESSGYFSRIARTVGLYTSRKPVNASSATWIASAAHSPIHASQ
jgi:hypothetical protein